MNVLQLFLFLFASLFGDQIALSPGTVGTPADSPGQGTYTATQSVTITVGSPGLANICYTTDGSTPAGTVSSCTNGTQYAGAFNIASTTTLKAIAYYPYWAQSAVLTSVYTINVGITFINNIAKGSTNSNCLTTSSVDTTGATLIVGAITQVGSASVSTFSDSQGGNSNTYTGLTFYQSIAADAAVKTWYVINPSHVGTGHTFTGSGSANYCSLFVLWFKGLPTGAETGANGHGLTTAATTVQPGTDTSTNNPQVHVSCWAGLGGNGSVNGSFAIPTNGTVAYSGGHTYGGACAYYIDTSGAAQNPTWTDTNSEIQVSNIAVFH